MEQNEITKYPLLGVNIDHVATLRQARGIDYPDPTDMALLAEQSGADYITLHLREDRRHIQDTDVENMHRRLKTFMNLEMAVTDEMVTFAKRLRPRDVCFVPEKREELTTEGGLDVCGQFEKVSAAYEALNALSIRVSLFIDADKDQIEAAHKMGVSVVEIHTGHYASASSSSAQASELQKVQASIEHAYNLGLQVNAGHGLNYQNVGPIAMQPMVSDLNIGHSLIAKALYVGIEKAVSEMKALMQTARSGDEG